MSIKTHFDALPDWAGRETGVSRWLVIDQARIDAFALATGDDQWIHVDAARAARDMPGGRTIAHGFLTLSLIQFLTRDLLVVEGAGRRINYGLNKVRFTAPVPAGSRVRARQTLLSVSPRGEALQTVNEAVIELDAPDGPRPACIAEIVQLWYRA